MKDLTVIIPIYQEDPQTVTKLYKQVKKLGCDVIVVDDGDTVDLPKSVPSEYYLPHQGYGYAIKTGIKKATTPIVMTMDGDGQHNPIDIHKLYTVYKMIKDCKMVIGQRWELGERFYRRWGRKCLNFVASCFSSHYLPDLNSGMRIFDRELAIAYMPILCDVFSFTTSLTMSMIGDGYRTVFIPIEVRKRAMGQSRVSVVKHGLVTLYYIIRIGGALRTRGIRAKLRAIRGQ